MRSKLLFFMYSYTSSLWGPSEQQPRSRTKFLCWMLVIILTSERNSDSPCWDFSRDNFLTATILPSANFPYEMAASQYPKWKVIKHKVWRWNSKDMLLEVHGGKKNSQKYRTTYCCLSIVPVQKVTVVKWIDNFLSEDINQIVINSSNISIPMARLFFFQLQPIYQCMEVDLMHAEAYQINYLELNWSINQNRHFRFSINYPIDRSKSTYSKKITRMKIFSCLLQSMEIKIAYGSKVPTPEICRSCIIKSLEL